MELKNHPASHLSYCSNLHPGSSWEEIREQLGRYLPELKKRLSPDAPFGVGLRLSAKAAYELRKPGPLRDFQNWLKQEDLYVFTVNGFVHGHFHATRVKDEVYQPHWGEDDRLNFTRAIIEIMTELTPAGGETSISTAPISYKYWGFSDEESNRIADQSARNLAVLAYEMARIEEEQQKLIHVDIEPEPDCYLETTDETIDYFQNILLTTGSEFLQETYSVSEDRAREILLRHIQVCFDTCHVALEYEDPAESIRKFREAGIGIGKVQISSALKVSLPEDRSAISKELQQFDEPVYLHQVLARTKYNAIQQYRDLNDGLKEIGDRDQEEWRVHYHVPVFMDSYGTLSSTQDDTIRTLNECFGSSEKICNHFEVETYTWDVLPDGLKLELADSVERELRWALEQISRASDASESSQG